MVSPRLYHPDLVIDCVEALVAKAGLEALTIRSLTRATGFSNGGIYRTFGSRGGLVGRMWIRAEGRYLQLLRSQIARANNPFDAVLAAAEASIHYPRLYPKSAAVLFTVRREEILSQPMSKEVGDQLRALGHELSEITSQLAIDLWNRCDAEALDLVAVCIHDLPKWIALRNMGFAKPIAGEYLRSAVRAVLDVGPPPLAYERASQLNGSSALHPSVTGCRQRVSCL
ncbi:TetR/AcrR family transcriptional regulator [Mycobacterium riyadhense]|uniref:HTH tetR-type domain-containing protein n=1 Tax=Mycobacterium riyadhense TaxID=486698 RepID=A0A1X2CKT1_9MYCO|nr:TetR/AcrR family transcriptional regulator [Mycobacterium riyadhense]ORW76616.1 hypothetical protein AWC22_21180 [Mycobacterium riyadhense]VTP01277.1 hypothetical protein BIN_B_03970 [Mycobacterium riyadhense]